MHFSKTYAQLLLTLPPELRDNAIQYRQLKKLINEVVQELNTLGLKPVVLQKLLEHSAVEINVSGNSDVVSPSATNGAASPKTDDLPKVIYEFAGPADHIEPRLRFSIHSSEGVQESSSFHDEMVRDWIAQPSTSASSAASTEDKSLLWLLQQRSVQDSSTQLVRTSETDSDIVELSTPDVIASTFASDSQDVVVPLASDTAFFQMLHSALETLTVHLNAVRADFLDRLSALATSISHTARPASSTSSFKPFSPLSHTHLTNLSPSSSAHKSDMYSWREIFQIYVDAEIFESHHEKDHGERSVEESERRLAAFAKRVTQNGLGDGRSLKLKESREALETFLQLNVLVLNLKKFQQANAEATRKILKKHAKRTSLPSPPWTLDLSNTNFDLAAESSHGALVPQIPTSLPRILIQAIGETLIPIIPSLDDYSCAICTSIAFKPIRLRCGHLFCVRCLVKMQKRNQENCPMCRSPSVLIANRNNLDWALLNFMQDWFPEEVKEKKKANEREAAEEELREMGYDPDQKGCCIA